MPSRRPLLLGGLAVVALALAVLLPNLGGYALWDPDEARHAEVARELFSAPTWREWIVPSLNYQPYHDKPIFFYWCASLAYAVGGVTAFAARMVSVKGAIVTSLAIYAWAATEWGVTTGLWSATVLLTAFEFAGLGRYASLDMLLTTWVTLGILAMDRWATAPRARPWWLAAGLLAGLGLMTKGLVAPVLIFGVGGTRFFGRDALRRPTVTSAVAALATCLAVAGPWYAAAALVDPGYIYDFFVRHHLQRALGGADRALGAHPKPFWFYVPVVLGGFFPWTGFLPGAVRRGPRDGRLWFCLGWAIAVVVLFSLSKGKLGTYILPCFPPLAVIVGRFLANAAGATGDPTVRRTLQWGGGLVAVVFLVAMPVVLALGAAGINPFPSSTSMLAGVGLPMGLALVWALRTDRLDLVPLGVTAGAIATFVTFYLAAAPQLSELVSEAPLAAVINDYPTAPGEPPPQVVAFNATPLSLLFYLRRPVAYTERPKPLAALLANAPVTFVVTSPKYVPQMLAAAPLFPWVTEGRHILYGTVARPTP